MPFIYFAQAPVSHFPCCCVAFYCFFEMRKNSLSHPRETYLDHNPQPPFTPKFTGTFITFNLFFWEFAWLCFCRISMFWFIYISKLTYGGVVPWSNPLWPLWSFNTKLRQHLASLSNYSRLAPLTGPSLLMTALETTFMYGSGHWNHHTVHRVPIYSLFHVFVHTGDISGLPPQICVWWPEAAAVTSVPWHRGKELCVFVPRGFT